MFAKLFGREKPSMEEVPKSYTERDVDAVYNALVDGLEKAKRRGAERVVLTVYETEPSQSAIDKVAGRMIPEDEFIEMTSYYTPKTFGGEEMRMVKTGKSYRILSLVNDTVGNSVSYRKDGIESYKRTRFNPMFGPLKPESNLHYVREGGVYSRENMKDFSRWAVESGWTPNKINAVVEDGIDEYNAKTSQLMEESGVNAALEGMKARKQTPFEDIMTEMRKNIRKAKE